MSDLNTVFVDLPSETTPIDAAYLNAANKRMRSQLPVIDVVEDHGAVVDGTTDDTAAWQAALTAAGAAGGARIICSRRGVSVIAGALTDTGGANAQLKIPAVDAPDSENITIVIEGALPPPNVVSVIGSTPTPDNHLVIKSTLGSGTGALLGAYGPVGTFQNFTNVTLRIENVTFRMPANPTNTALDLRRVACVDLDHVIVDAGSYHVTGLSAQTTATSFGIRCPGNNNGAHVRLGHVDVVGFYNGIEYSEHSYGEYVAAWGCKVGHTFVAANHASKFQRLATYHCQKGIAATGTHYVDIDQFDIEHAASGTWVTSSDIDDASNYLHGYVWWHVVLANTGIDATFTKNGATGLQVNRMGTALGGGSTVYKGHDRLVAAAGNNTLTLGAAPVAGSPLVWVNNVIKWPVTDYTISGSVITFGTALSASDVVLVYYDTLTSSPPASALSTSGGVTITDDFNRANSTNSLGTTSVGAKVWTQQAGTWGIDSNRAYVSSGVSAQTCKAVIDAAVSNCTVAGKVIEATAGSNPLMGLVVRSDGAGNEYVVEITVGFAGTPKIYKGTGGSYTTLATGASTTVASGSVLSVELSGNTITVKDDGVTIVSATDSSWSANTRHGMYIVAPASTTSNARVDDFSVTS